LSILKTASVPQTRLNVDGVRVSKQKIQDEILEKLRLVKTATPTQMAQWFNMTRENFSRSYLYPMVESGKVKKIDGTNSYALAETTVTGREQIKKELLTKSEFFECQTIKNWLANSSAKDEIDTITQFIRLCLGKYNPKFKINPDNWQHPQTTLELKVALEEYYNTKKFPWSIRQTVRQFLDKGCGLKLNKSEMERLGFSGEKDTPKASTLHMTRDQYAQGKEILEQADLVWYCKFIFSFWTFCRPSSKYIVTLDQLEFFDRTIEYVEKQDGTIISQPERVEDYKNFLELNPNLAEKIQIKSRIERACRLELFEHKTQKAFPKRIYDHEAVLQLEKFVRIRKSQHKKYLFWENNDTEFTFETYDKIVVHQVTKDNVFFGNLYMQVGFTRQSFGKSLRANYALRHFGLQHWLQLTDYDFGFVSTMSHDDLATLKRWYGEYAAEHLEKKMQAVVF